MALATPEQLAAYLGRTPDAGPAEFLVDAVSAEVQALCGWHIAPQQTDTVTVDGSGSLIQALPTLRLADLLSVTEDGAAVDLAGLQWSEAGYLWRSTPWTRKLRGVVAEIQHGYPETPPEVVAIVCGAAARGLANPGGVVQERSGGESVTYTYAATGTASLLTEVERRVLERRYQIANPA